MPKALLPFLVLKLFCWNCFQLVSYNLLNVVYSSKVIFLEMAFDFQKEESHMDSNQENMEVMEPQEYFYGPKIYL
ncbi:hypothetical protein HZH68_001013 [Vespula germanica]|uniref:Uncharacterized protein n=1 Tax=Vespula germanica TaxID=30212 RepID=A0A834NUM6_VESGE|nr:hypothetical protein HZH68_001013 [Vespula germanica]